MKALKIKIYESHIVFIQNSDCLKNLIFPVSLESAEFPLEMLKSPLYGTSRLHILESREENKEVLRFTKNRSYH